MKKFFKGLLPIERLALVGAAVATIILVWLGISVPTAGLLTLFMFGTLTGFWALMTMVSAVSRYISTCKAEQEEQRSTK